MEFSRILNPKPGEWLTYNGKLSGNRYSELDQNQHDECEESGREMELFDSSVEAVASGYALLRENMRYFGLESTPLVADGIMYVTGPQQVSALDALTGRPIWTYSRPRTAGLVSDPSLGTNRGVALLDDKVFTGDRQRPPGCFEPDDGPAGVGSRDAGRASALRVDGGAVGRQGHGHCRGCRRRLGYSWIPRRLQGLNWRTFVALLDHPRAKVNRDPKPGKGRSLSSVAALPG